MDKTDISSNILDAIEVIKTMCIPYLQHTTDDNCVICNALRTIVEYYEQPNEPLTIEELKDFAEMPYYHVELLSNVQKWLILPNHIAQYPNSYNYGKTWLAYRRKKED
jgi:hypothetical protein